MSKCRMRGAALHARAWTYRELRRTMTRRQIELAVEAGQLLRLRKGSYVDGRIEPRVLTAARLGGRLDCVSLLDLVGIFVFGDSRPHVQMNRTSTRVERRAGECRRHWRRTCASPGDLLADLQEALAQACRCQDVLHAVATLDSALHLGAMGTGGLDAVFEMLPVRFEAMRSHLDARSEAGSESILRVLLRRRGWQVEVQVRIDGVGRVDLVVDGWLIVECDSEEFHGGWADRKRDLRRDLAAARLGYTTVRPIAEDILWHTDDVITSIDTLLRHRRG